MYKAASAAMQRSPALRRTLNRVFYNYLARLDAKQGDVTLMNYGYHDESTVPLQDADEPNRYCLQMYHRIASAVEPMGKDVLEVGSGRGGGASYVMRYLKPRTMTGVDFSDQAVAFCQRTHVIDGLRYVHGDAENLPFEDASFDAVINVESSHCYGDFRKFVGQVYRVLRPGRVFSWTDHRPPAEIDSVKADLRGVGFEIVREDTITPYVLASMRVLGERNRALIHRRVPAPARPIFENFAGVEGSQIYEHFATGLSGYYHFVMRKPG